MDRIKALMKEVKDLMASEENLRRRRVQQRLGRLEAVFPPPINSWDITAGFPIMLLGWCERLGRPLDVHRVSHATGPLTRDYAAELVEFQLLQKIEKFRNTPDDLPMSAGLCTNMGLCWLHRPGALGVRYIVEESTGAFVPDPIVKTEADLDKIELPRFEFDAALHEQRIGVFKEVVDGEFPVGDDNMPGGIGAPFSTANNLRGVLELLEDFVVRPKFVHRLMDFIAEAILASRAARGGGFGMATFGCDEVSCDMFSPAQYEEFIYPYEVKASAAFASIYYHSCGNLTPLFAKIVTIPHVHRVHVSPWSDHKRAIEAIGGKVVLEKHLDPRVEWDKLSREEMRPYVREITDLGLDYPLDLVVETARPGGKLFREVLYEETGA
jgi:hypothetical protein